MSVVAREIQAPYTLVASIRFSHGDGCGNGSNWTETLVIDRDTTIETIWAWRETLLKGQSWSTCGDLVITAHQSAGLPI